jgi:hypothetical protein
LVMVLDIGTQDLGYQGVLQHFVLGLAWYSL